MQIRWSSNFFLILTVSLVRAAQPQQAPQVLTFFVERELAPLHQKEPLEKTRILKKVSDPYELNRILVKGHIRKRTVEGLVATYFGWWTYSDYHGQVVFPLHHEQPKLLVVITPKISPILTHDHMVEGFFIPPDVTYDVYNFERTIRKNSAEWTIKKSSLPAQKKVPLNALVILAKPEDIPIHEGSFPGIKSGTDFVLPPLTIAHDTKLVMDALHSLTLNRYFSPVDRIMVTSKARYAFVPTP